MAKARRTVSTPSRTSGTPNEPRNSRATMEVDPTWLEEGPASERKSRASRMSLGAEERKTIDVDPAWLERSTLAPAETRGKAKPPPLPQTPAQTEEEAEDEAPARGAIPPPLPKTARASKKPRR